VLYQIIIPVIYILFECNSTTMSHYNEVLHTYIVIITKNSYIADFNSYVEFVIVGFNLNVSWCTGCEMFLYWISWAAVGIEFCFAVLAVGKRLSVCV